MKQTIDLIVEGASDKEQEFIRLWKMRKGYTNATTLSIGELLELIVAISTNLHYEESTGRFFNNALLNDESVVMWEGQELIDILFYEFRHILKQKMVNTRVFPED